MGDLLHLTVGPRRGMLRGTSATAWYERGCAAEATDPATARAAYERALAGRPDFADAHNNLGRVLHALHDDAVTTSAANPGRTNDRTADDAAAIASSPTALLAAAESHYRLAICGNPTVALYWFNLGVSVEDQGRVAEAISAYERALEIDQTLADAHFNLARLFEAIGRSSADELVLRRAVRHLVRYRDLVA